VVGLCPRRLPGARWPSRFVESVTGVRVGFEPVTTMRLAHVKQQTGRRDKVWLACMEC
jgi:hypothetical protein